MLSDFLSKDFKGSVNELNESFLETSFKLSLTDDCKNESDRLFDQLKTISPRDKFEMFVVLNGESIKINSCNQSSYDQLSQHFKNHDEITQSEVEVSIQKSNSSSTISIYFFDIFVSFLNQEPLLNILKSYSKNLKDKPLNFEVFSTIREFGTLTIKFFQAGTSSSAFGSVNFIRRDELIDSLHENGIIWNPDLRLLPSDFEFEIESEDQKISKLFNRASAVLSLAFLSNNSELSIGNKFNYRVCGYKSVTTNVEKLVEIEVKSKLLIKVFKWAYEGGSNSDKLGLVRNLFSIHMGTDGKILLDEDVWSAIQSNYQIYLRGNIQSYLEVKNKIGELLIDSISKTDLIVDSFLDSLKQNAAVLVTFILTVVVINGLKDTNVQLVFSNAYLFIFIALVVISTIWMKGVTQDVRARFSNATSSIETVLINNYNKLLLEDEIVKTIEPIKLKHEAYLKAQLDKYTKWWNRFLILLVTIFIIGNCIFAERSLYKSIDEAFAPIVQKFRIH